MKKHSFYSLMRKDGKNKAVLHNGFSDGTFYYYKDNYTWYAIHPLCGLSVCYGYTRKECADKAHAPALFAKITEDFVKRGETLTAQFENAIRELKAEG